MLALSCLAALMLTGCKCPLGTRITVANSDSTPPKATLSAAIVNGTNFSTSSESPQIRHSIDAFDTDVISLVASGGDMEGIKEIQIWVSETAYRQLGNGLSQQIGPGLLSGPATNTIATANRGDTMCTPIMVSYELRMAGRRENNTSLKVDVWSAAINHAGQTTVSPTISFKIGTID
jgi:hypothetical protein